MVHTTREPPALFVELLPVRTAAEQECTKHCLYEGLARKENQRRYSQRATVFSAGDTGFNTHTNVTAYIPFKRRAHPALLLPLALLWRHINLQHRGHANDHIMDPTVCPHAIESSDRSNEIARKFRRRKSEAPCWRGTLSGTQPIPGLL